MREKLTEETEKTKKERELKMLHKFQKHLTKLAEEKSILLAEEHRESKDAFFKNIKMN